MGNSLEQWRASIGQYHGAMPREARTIKDVGECGSMAFVLVVVATLLVISGIELNPGPHTQAFKYPETTAKPKVERRLPDRAEMTGEFYEVGMVTLLFLKGLFEKASFTLGSNVKGVGAFDDLAFSWREKTSNIDHKVYIQLKHLKTKAVVQEMLCAKQGNFSIFKYFNSFCLVEEDIRNKSEFVLFTNASVKRGTTQREPNSQLKQLLNTAASPDKILCFQKGDKEYQILEKLYKDTLKRISAMTGGIKAIMKELEPFQQLDACKKLIAAINNQTEFEALFDHHLSQELDEKLWEQFMDKFHLFSCQASEKELDPVIKKTLEEYVGTDKIFQDLKTAVIKWWRQDVAYTITHEYALFWDEVMREHISGLVKPISDKLLSIPELTFRERKDFGRVCFVNDCTLLSCLWVQQCASAIGHIMVDNNTLTTRTEEVLAIWKFCTWCRLLVVEGEIESKLLERLASILSGDKQLIVISKNAKELAKHLVKLIETTSLTININVEDIEIYDECFRLDQLDEISQEKVFESDVLFQGSLVKLRSLADEATLRDVVTVDIVLQLFSEDAPMLVRESLPFKQDGFYICRKMFRNEVIGNNVFKSNLILAVSGVSEIELDQLLPFGEVYQKFHSATRVNRSCRYFLITGRSDFDALATEFPQSVHWIEKHESVFIWKSSNGNLEAVREYLEDSPVDFENIEKFVNTPHQVVLVVAEPGMGKSVELTNVAQQLKGFDPTIWIVRVNLIEHTQFLSQSDFSVEGLLMNAGNFKSEFERKLFEHQLKSHRKLVYLFDGMDEISPMYADKVIDMLKKLSGKSLKIWLTSRPFMREKLENEFHTLSFNFVPFTEKDQQEFFMKFWEVPNDSIHIIKKLFTVIRNSLNDSLMKFTSIPLQAKMLAEVYQNEVLRYTETGEINIPDRLDLLSLYQEFVEKKWEVHRSKLEVDASKPGNDEDSEYLKEMFVKKLMNCSLITLLDEELEKLHNPEKIRKNNQKYVSEFKAGRERKGLVADVKDDKAIFIHQTFAEYFAAIWFSENYSSNLECFFDFYISPKYNVIRCFFDRILSQKCALHTAVLNYDKCEVERLLSEPDQDVNEKDEGGRLALHLAISNFLEADAKQEENSFIGSIGNFQKITENALVTKFNEIVNILLIKGSYFSEKDKILFMTPLQLAEYIGAWSIVERLLENGANSEDLVLIPNNINRSDDDFVKHLLITSAVGGYVNLLSFMLKCNSNLTFEFDSNLMLHNAASRGNLKMVQFLIEYGADVEGQCDCCATPLLWAARSGSVQIIQHLKECSADVNALDTLHYSALHHAVEGGNLECVNILIDFGANLDCKNIRGQIPVMQALAQGEVEVAKLFFERGANPDVMNEYGYSALHYAVGGGNLECVNILIDFGANVNCKNERGETPLITALKLGNVEVAILLLGRGAKHDIMDEDGDSTFHYAVRTGDVDCVNVFLDRGVNVDCENVWDRTPLMWALKMGKVEVPKLLLEHGVKHDILDEDGNSALHYAVGGGNLECVNILIDFRANLDCKNERSETPLIWALEMGKVEIAILLMERGANPDVTDKYGNSALHYAVRTGVVECVNTILGLEVNVDCQNKRGETPLIWALKMGKLEVAKLFLDHGVKHDIMDEDGNSALHFAVETRDINCVHILMNFGVNVDCKNKMGETPLIWALKMGNVEVEKLLLDHGVKHDVMDGDDNSALHYAVRTGVVECVNIFLDLKMNVDCKNKRGETPLMQALAQGELEVAKLLLERRANPDVMDGVGNSALHYAVTTGDVECVDIFLGLGVNVDCKNKRGQTPLISALELGYAEVATLLLEHEVKHDIMDEDGNSALHYAVRTGVECVNIVLGLKMNVDCKNKRGETPLMLALAQGKVEVAKLLLERGANPDVMDEYGNSALHCAVRTGDVECVKILMNFGVNVDCKNKRGETPLIWALALVEVKVAKLLLEHEVKRDIMDEDGNSALHYAVRTGYVECVSIFLGLGVIADCKNKRGQTPLIGALKMGKVEVAKLLLKQGVKRDIMDEDGNSALHYAVRTKDINCVKMLLDLGVNVDCKNKSGETPLIMALAQGEVEVAKLLLELGVKRDVMDGDGNSALHYAVRTNDIKCVKMLLDFGVNVDCKNKRGETPLMEAMEMCNVEIAKLLLEQGVKHDFMVEDGNSALRYAVLRGHLNCVNLLLDFGANVNCQNKRGQTPLMEALEIGKVEVAKLLFDEGAKHDIMDEDGNSTLHYAVLGGNIVCVKLCIGFGVNTDCQNKRGETPLVWACEQGELELAKLLLEHGTNPDTSDKFSNSPLHYAVLGCIVKCVNLLLDFGANVDCKNKIGQTPLMGALEHGEMALAIPLLQHGAETDVMDEDGNSTLHYAVLGGNIKCVNILLDFGVNVDCKNKRGQTPLIRACEEGQVEIAKLLLK